MTGTSTKDDGLDARRRRVLFRAWRRGTREADLILGGFADRYLQNLTATEIAAFERLLDLPDQDVFSWIAGDGDPPAAEDSPLLRSIIAFHRGARKARS